MLTKLLADLRELLLPRLCPVCGKLLMEGEDVLCAFCALGLPVCHIQQTNDNRLTRLLWSKVDIQGAFAFLTYNPFSPYHRLVIDLKFHGKGDTAIRLGRWAATAAMRTGFWKSADAMVPVPLTRWRRYRRGYNQAELLARGMSEVNGLPVVNLLRRTKNRTPQSRLSGEKRRKNAEGIYLATIPEEWRGKHLVLVDDVMTTGSTLAACAQALLKAAPEAKISVCPLAYAGDY